VSYSVEQRVQAQYGKQAQLYSVSRTHSSGDTLQMLVDMADLDGSERVLDVATGTGFCAMAFAPHVREVVAYDLTPEMLAEAERLAASRGLTNMRVQQGAAESMPFGQGEFQVVTTRVAPHHFTSVPRFLAEALRVLSPGGKLLIADTAAPDDSEADRWANEVELLRDPSHVRDYNRTEWRDFVGSAGFAAVDAELRSQTPLTFDDWVLRSGTTADVIDRLRGMYAKPPAAAREAFTIHSLTGGDFGWQWPVVVVTARKPN
jgi:ubiquinone/menaquinone biosynthesis C-methylase UbiE